MTEAGNDKVGYARNEAIRAEVLDLDRVWAKACASTAKLPYPERCRELRRLHFALMFEARARARKYRKGVCEFCGERDKLHAHHINGNVWDNRRSNIGTLCVDCHNLLHSWMKPSREWCKSGRRELWLQVLNDARMGPLKWDYAPPILRWSRALKRRVNGETSKREYDAVCDELLVAMSHGSRDRPGRKDR